MSLIVNFICLNLVIWGSSGCENLLQSNKESEKIKTIYKSMGLIEDKNYSDLKKLYGTEYFVTSEADFEIKVNQAADLLKKYGLPDKKNISFRYSESSSNNLTTTYADAILVNRNLPSENIKNAYLEFVFVESFGSNKIVDFTVQINSLPNTQLPPLKN